MTRLDRLLKLALSKRYWPNCKATGVVKERFYSNLHLRKGSTFFIPVVLLIIWKINRYQEN